MAYDLDELVRLLTDYYNFCNRVFWNATVVQTPAGGWPSINQETLAALKRNDTVIDQDLLRHIPYVDYREGDSSMAPFLMKDTPVPDYRSRDLQKKIREGRIEGVLGSRHTPYNLPSRAS